MVSGILARLRPTGPLRIGNGTALDDLLHSDTLFAALTHAIAELDSIEQWLDATARNPEGSAVRLSSCFPYLDDTLYVVPPRTVWPPVTSTKLRWQSARFVPFAVIHSLLQDLPLEDDKWWIDSESGCLLAVGKAPRPTGPFRTVTRSRAGVDRLTGASEHHRAQCIEFRANAGLWLAISFSNEAAAERWSPVVLSALRLLGDMGIGGERSSGWGHFTVEGHKTGELAELLNTAVPASNGESRTAHWLLSLFSPAPADELDWLKSPHRLLERTGRVSSTGALQKVVRMVAEGSVLSAANSPRGAAPDVAPEGSTHPVYRSGIALSIPIPTRGNA